MASANRPQKSGETVTFGDGTDDISINGDAIGFFGATPAARQTYTAPTGTPSRTALSATETDAATIAAKVVALITDLKALGLLG